MSNLINTTEKKILWFALPLLAAIIYYSAFSVSAASPPSVITYQGKLLVNNLNATTTQSIQLRLYDALTGGNLLYTAAGTLASPTALSVTPTSGLFSVDLGGTGTNSLSPDIFQNNQNLYLEVRVGSETLSPRKQITASPFAFNALYLNGVAATSTASSSTYIPVSDSRGSFNFGVNVTNVIQQGATPIQVATTTFASGATPTAVFVSGRYAYVTNGNNNLTGTDTLVIIDITNPTAPVQIATTTFVSGANPLDVYVSGRYAYVVNFENDSLAIVDVSNPAVPAQISTTTFATNANPYAVYASGRYVYVANFGEDTLAVVDVSNPAAPAQISSLSLGSGANPFDVYVSGRYAYVANSGSSTLSIIDITGSISKCNV